MNNTKLFFLLLGFIITYLYQCLEDKRLKIIRYSYWNKLKCPFLNCLIIYFIICFYDFNSSKKIMNNYEIFTELPNF